MSEKYKNLLDLTVKNIIRRRLRSILTIIAITIGIATIVSLFLISDGLFNYVESEFEKMGINTIFIFPISYTGGPVTIAGRVSDDITLKERDVRLIERINEVENVFGFSFRTGKIEFRNEEVFQFIIMIESDKVDQAFETMSLELREGRSIQNRQGRNVILGPYIADSLFQEPIRVGQRIKIQDQDYKVMGILEPIGNLQDDSQVYITRDSGKDLYNINDSFDQMIVRVKPEFDAVEVSEDVERRLEREYGEDKFFIITATQVLTIIRSVLDLLKIVLVSIGLISILVASIGIINSIYTSVIERTKEIGILKSLGAKREDIYFIFISESLILSIIGSIIGFGLGYLIAKGVEYYVSSQGIATLKIIVNLQIVLIVIGVAIIVGFIAGLFPSNKASKMNAVEALKKAV